MIKKGIILAGGLGTRLSPLTKPISKQLLPIYDKPLIFYPLSVLMLCNIRDVLIIVKKGEKENFKKVFGNGNDLGIKINYKEQLNPKGIPDAFIVGENFIKNSNIALILGDNFFYGQGLSEILRKSFSLKNGACIFTYPINNPENFGIVEKIRGSKKLKIIEKPKKTKSNRAITGLYIFDNSVVKYSKSIKTSKRNETEIVDLINIYNKKNKLKVTDLGRGSTWLDTGTIESLLAASNYVQVVEERQKYKIACLEEISYLKGWIQKKNILNRIKFYGNCNYSKYLKELIN
jgi:glucose-1-phosphate thymidylyltransferase|tara:strand:- start:815 stop:1684 length:870 start_codon:yes stop_codon:yes gene_type:complete